MTWSIVAYDQAAGAFGAAVATKAFASGTFVPFVQSGVGAVGTQSLTNRYLGPAVLSGLGRGLSAKLAIDAAIAGDEGREVRQLHCVDRQGRIAAWGSPSPAPIMKIVATLSLLWFSKRASCISQNMPAAPANSALSAAISACGCTSLRGK